MAERDPVIELRDVALLYRLAKHRITSFKEYVVHFLRGSLQYEDLWALRGIDLVAHRGEAIGVIGANAAGKSTLLKVIAGILQPTRGVARVSGRVMPILSLGAGFDFELTGLENVYINGLLLGKRRREIAATVPDIVEFSGLGDFINAPLRNYSAGMVARLGFSIVTAWSADVLLIDEALAVGDAAFVRRCHERLDEFRRAGSTLVLVTHNASAIEEHCTRCVWLDRGTIRADGAPSEVLPLYDRAERGDSAPTIEGAAGS